MGSGNLRQNDSYTFLGTCKCQQNTSISVQVSLCFHSSVLYGDINALAFYIMKDLHELMALGGFWHSNEVHYFGNLSWCKVYIIKITHYNAPYLHLINVSTLYTQWNAINIRTLKYWTTNRSNCPRDLKEIIIQRVGISSQGVMSTSARLLPYVFQSRDCIRDYTQIIYDSRSLPQWGLILNYLYSYAHIELKHFSRCQMLTHRWG